MITVERLGLHLLLAVLVAVSAGSAEPSVQQEKEKNKDSAPKANKATAKSLEPKQQPKKEAQAKRPVPRVVQAQWTDETFDQWVFQQDRTASGARRRIDSQLALRIDDIDRVCRLTEGQKKKLELAAHGDIKRFFDRYETIKKKFQSLKNDQQQVNNMWQEISPLQISLQGGLFDSDSLLQKLLKHTLTSEQFVRYQGAARERRDFHHRADIELVIAAWDQSMPLSEVQRRDLTTFLANETKPPRKSGVYDYHVIICQLSHLPEEKLKSHFDDMQWKVVKWYLAQIRAMEPWLKQSGQWPGDDDELEQADVRPATPE
jgi:hypothetical protein